MRPSDPITLLRDKLGLSSLGKKGFVRNVATYATGVALSQALTLAAMPLLSRIYSPDAFGILAVFVAVRAVASHFSCLGYQGAIVLPKRNESAFALCVACFGLGLFISMAVLIVVYFLSADIARLLGNPEIEPWLWLVPVSMFIWAGFESTSFWCTRSRAFGEASKGIVATRGSTAALQIGLGVTREPTANGLINGQVLGLLSGLIVILYLGAKNVKRRYWNSLSIRHFVLLLYRYRQFPRYGLLSNVAAATVRALPVLFLGYFFNPAVAGFFAMANRLIAAPCQLITASLVKVFFERANRANLDGNMDAVTSGVYERLIMLLTTPLTLLGVAAPELVVVVLGEQWFETSVYLRWLCGWLLFISAISPLDRVFLIAERQIELAAVNIGLFVVGAGALIAGGLMQDAQLAVGLFCVSTTVLRLVQGARILHIAGASVTTLFTAPSKEFLLTLPYIAALIATRYITDNTWIYLSVFLGLIGLFTVSRAKAIIKPAS